MCVCVCRQIGKWRGVTTLILLVCTCTSHRLCTCDMHMHAQVCHVSQRSLLHYLPQSLIGPYSYHC